MQQKPYFKKAEVFGDNCISRLSWGPLVRRGIPVLRKPTLPRCVYLGGKSPGPSEKGHSQAYSCNRGVGLLVLAPMSGAEGTFLTF